ncbi:MAG: T9SS type A sorting domain-containing protein [Bacteroidales bacterium]|nr:T9SS type A sorting domain-containing protein [Bacteroidales bacterium]
MKTIFNTLKAIMMIACMITLSSGEGRGAPSWQEARFGAVGFSIGSMGYIGTGLGYINNVLAFKKDLWEYNPATDSWTQKADLGGVGRAHATGLSIGNKGYIGLGQDDYGVFSDFWEYDPVTNTWLQKADFPGLARKNAPGFSIGNKGYLGTGLVFYPGEPPLHLQDFWEYDPTVNAWLQKADFPGAARFAAAGFSINAKGYLGTGATWLSDTEYIHYTDFYEYNPVNDIWIIKAPFAGAARYCAAGFGIGSKGYIGTGSNNVNFNLLKDFWEYNPANNAWIQKASFKGKARRYATGFSIGTRGYIGTGHMGNSYEQDFWEYNQVTNAWTQKTDLGSKHKGPLKEVDAIAETGPANNTDLSVYPNPSNTSFNFRLNTASEEPVSIKLFDMTGRLVYEHTSLPQDEIITAGDNLGAGVYVAVLTQGACRKSVKLNKVR